MPFLIVRGTMSVRQSKRLKASAAKAVVTASASISTRAGGRKTRAKSSDKAAVAAETAEVEAEATTTMTTTTTTTTTKAKAVSGAAKDAWGALFASQKARKQDKQGESAGAARPRRVDGVPAELQDKIDAFPRFEGVSRRGYAPGGVKIVAWNVNGLRAVLKRDKSVHLRAYVAQEDPDVLCLSETKIGGDELQKLDDFLPQYAHQYWSCAAKKGYSGTAIFSKTKPLRVKDSLVVGAHTPKSSGKAKAAADSHEEDQEGRFLAVEFADFWLVHTYVPNAGGALERLDYRTTQWDRAIERELCALEKDGGKPVVWCGDLNVAHEEIDIHDPKGNRNKSAGFTDQERESFSQILAAKSDAAAAGGLGDGFVDTFRELHPEEQQFSYFSYRFNARARNKGWRLDYFVASRALLPRVVRATCCFRWG